MAFFLCMTVGSVYADTRVYWSYPPTTEQRTMMVQWLREVPAGVALDVYMHLGSTPHLPEKGKAQLHAWGVAPSTLIAHEEHLQTQGQAMLPQAILLDTIPNTHQTVCFVMAKPHYRQFPESLVPHTFLVWHELAHCLAPMLKDLLAHSVMEEAGPFRQLELESLVQEMFADVWSYALHQRYRPGSLTPTQLSQWMQFRNAASHLYIHHGVLGLTHWTTPGLMFAQEQPIPEKGMTFHAAAAWTQASRPDPNDMRAILSLWRKDSTPEPFVSVWYQEHASALMRLDHAMFKKVQRMVHSELRQQEAGAGLR